MESELGSFFGGQRRPRKLFLVERRGGMVTVKGGCRNEVEMSVVQKLREEIKAIDWQIGKKVYHMAGTKKD